jgi:hypothetical protein
MPATLPTEFTAQAARLRERAAADALAAQMPGVYRRGWVLPVGAPNDDPAVPATLAVARAVLNDAYKTTLTTGAADDGYGRLGPLAAYKSAIDYLAALERALHAEYANRNRAARWAAARRAAHGDATYGAVAAAERDLRTALAAGG